MRLHTHRRFIAGTALLAFLFAVAFPALAVVRQAVDPLAYTKICRVDTGFVSGDVSETPESLQNKIKFAHCLMCVGTVSPPPAISVAPVTVSAIPGLLLSVERRPPVVGNAAALQPLNPRAPPRV